MYRYICPIFFACSLWAESDIWSGGCEQSSILASSHSTMSADHGAGAATGMGHHHANPNSNCLNTSESDGWTSESYASCGFPKEGKWSGYVDNIHLCICACWMWIYLQDWSPSTYHIFSERAILLRLMQPLPCFGRCKVHQLSACRSVGKRTANGEGSWIEWHEAFKRIWCRQTRTEQLHYKLLCTWSY